MRGFGGGLCLGQQDPILHSGRPRPPILLEPSGAWSPCDKVQGQPLGLQSSQSVQEGSCLMRKENIMHVFWTYFTGKLLFFNAGLLQVDPRKCRRTSGWREWTERTCLCVKLLGSQVTALSHPANVSLWFLSPSPSVPPGSVWAEKIWDPEHHT